MTNPLAWTEKFSVNVKSLDDQHKEFIRICNELISLSNQKEVTNETMLIALSRLINYAHYHLTTEEEYFKQTEYPETEEHIQAHDEFRGKTSEYIDNARKNINISKLTEEASQFAGNWLLEHILVVDKRYSKWLNDHGINGQ